MKSEQNHYLTVQHAANFLGVTSETIRRWARSKKIKGLKIGTRGDWRFTREDLLGMQTFDDIITQKNSEQKIEDQAYFLKAVTDTNPDMISVINLQTNDLEFANAKAFITQGFGTGKDHFEKNTLSNWKNVVHPDDQKATDNYFKAFLTMKDDEVQNLEYRATNNRGEDQWYFVQGKVFKRNALGIPTHAISVVHNISQQIQSQQEILQLKDEILQKTEDDLRLKENQFNTVLKGSPVFVSSLDKNFRYTFWSHNPTLGINSDNIIGEKISFSNPKLQKFMIKKLMPVLKKGKTVSFEVPHLIHNRYYMCYAEPLLSSRGEIEGVSLVSWDITKQKETEQALYKSQERLAKELADTKLLQTISTRLIAVHDDSLYEEIMRASKSIMHSNMASIQIFSPDKNALYLLGQIGFHPESTKFWEWVDAGSGSTCGVALANNKRIIVTDIENCEFMEGTGDLKAYRLSGIRSVQSTPLVSRSGKIVGMFSTHWKQVHEPSERELSLLDVLARQVADIIERKFAQEALKESIFLRDEFIAIASHELKTPLTSTKIFTQILQKQFKDDPKATAFLNRMNDQVNNLTTLISEMLDTTRIQKGKLEFKLTKFIVKDLALEIINDLQQISNHKLIVEWETNEFVVADKERVKQVLTNYITNAIKYSPDGKKIIIRSQRKNGLIVVSVRDFGIGIHEEEQKNIFERFYRANKKDGHTYPGLGLGLYISKEIITQMKGKVWVESEIGKGSTFFFSLPIVKDKNQKILLTDT